MIGLALKGYRQIEEKRLAIVDSIEEVHEFIEEFYPEKPTSVTKAMLNEALSCFQMYSRLNSTLLCHYIIG